jgi:hypothetical protein
MAEQRVDNTSGYCRRAVIIHETCVAEVDSRLEFPLASITRRTKKGDCQAGSWRWKIRKRETLHQRLHPDEKRRHAQTPPGRRYVRDVQRALRTC